MVKHSMDPDHSLYRIAVLGDGGVGKTSLTIQLCHERFHEQYDPTFEDTYRKPVTIDDQRYMIEILDTAGQEEYKSMQDRWANSSHGIILVYSVTSRDSFEKIGTLFQEVLRAKGWGPDDPAASTPRRLPIMIVGNKSDKLTERTVSTEEGQKFARGLHCEFIETSAKKNFGVRKAFHDVVKMLIPDRMASTPMASTGVAPPGNPQTSACLPLVGICGDGGCCIVM